MRFWRRVADDDGPSVTRRWFAWYPVKDQRNGGWIWLEDVFRMVAGYGLPRYQWRYTYEAIDFDG